MTSQQPRIGIVIGSTREGRFGEKPAHWIHEIAKQRTDLAFELIDLRDHLLPFFNEAMSPAWAPVKNEAAQRWAAKLNTLDGLIVVTPEYNHGPSAVLKNAFDYAYKEFGRKPIGFVGYGSVGAARAVEQLRLVAVEMQMAPVRHAVHIGMVEFLGIWQQGKAFEDFPHLAQAATGLLDDMAWWARALKTARASYMSITVAIKARAIVHRTRGSAHGPITRLVSPGDLGQFLKPFVFLDLFDHDGAPFNGNLHPHSGIATLTYILEGAVSYIDPDNSRGTLPAGGVEWMQAGRGMWHGGGIDKGGRTQGFQLWIALPPALELGPTISICQAPEDVQEDGPARVLLGSYGSASSTIKSPSPINYLTVRLKGGECWRYTPPAGHSVGWVAVNAGRLDTGDDVGGPISAGELAVFEESDDAIDFLAQGDTEFVLGSAVKHPHELVLGYYSVHTSKAALAQGEAEIQRIGTRLRKEGRLT